MDILSLGLGGILRLAPEMLNYFDRKNKRKHDLAMADKGIEGKEVQAQGEVLKEAIKAQGVITGVRWADALNMLVRPLITYWWVIVLYTAYLIASFVVLLDTEGAARAIIKLFGDSEKAIVHTIITFWFVDRVIRHNKE